MLHTVAAVLIYLAGALIVFFDWVATPLNRNIVGQRASERMPSTLIHGGTALVLGSLCLFAFWPAYWVSGFWFGIVLVSAVRNWWIPYFGGKASGEITPEIYGREYSRNLSVLPRLGTAIIVPDLQHIVIHLSLLLAMASSFIAGLWG